MKLQRQKFLLAAVGTAGLALSAVHSTAAPFAYNNRDVFLGFRSVSSPFDYVVNLGSVSLFTGAAPGTTFNVNAYSGANLSAFMGGVNNLTFSVFADVPSGTGDATFPERTLWVTRARGDINTLSTPWIQQSALTQGTVAGKINGIADGTVTYSGTIPGGATNTANSVTVSDTWNASGQSYSLNIGPNGDFAGTFQGNIENTTPAGFSTNGVVARSDFYQLKPGSGAGTYLGYFQLGNNGTMTFTTAVPEPSTWAMLACGAALLVSFHRIRRQS